MSARFSRQQSSLTARMRNLRQAPNVSDRKSKDRRGRSGTGIGDRLPRARLRPRLRRTDSPSSQYPIELLFVHDHALALQHDAHAAVKEKSWSPASSRQSATALHFSRHLRTNALLRCRPRLRCRLRSCRGNPQSARRASFFGVWPSSLRCLWTVQRWMAKSSPQSATSAASRPGVPSMMTNAGCFSPRHQDRRETGPRPPCSLHPYS